MNDYETKKPPLLPRQLRGIEGVMLMREWREEDGPVRLYGATDGRRWEYRPGKGRKAKYEQRIQEQNHGE